MNSLILSLGSNQGEKLDFLLSALSEIKEEIGPIEEYSSVYESQAIGFETVDTFYNLCAHVTTKLTPESALEKALQIEALLGRKRNSTGYSSRTIDIDLIYFDDLIIDIENLNIPHPRMHERLFVLIPLNELTHSIMHPIYNKNTTELIAEITNQEIPKKVIDRNLIQY
jgi:2-amino-4-hydroxy-6-hydroxymethyldihydropteridine diphosphokinase